jgi:hypothetical protein
LGGGGVSFFKKLIEKIFVRDQLFGEIDFFEFGDHRKIENIDFSFFEKVKNSMPLKNLIGTPLTENAESHTVKVFCTGDTSILRAHDFIF